MKKAFELKGPDRVLHIHHTPRGPEHVDVELRPILDDHREVVAYVERLTTGLAQRVASFHGTRRELAAKLGLGERTLYRRLKAIGLA